MPDSKGVVFTSTRNGTFGIYKQGLDETTAQAIVTRPDPVGIPVMSPDGTWILYWAPNPHRPDGGRVMRVPTSGGAPQLVLEGRDLAIACTRYPATMCVLSEANPDKKTQIIISSFDPVKGRGRELTRINLDPDLSVYNWALSPDGSQIAVAQYFRDRGPIQILPLDGGKAREINVKGLKGLMGVIWAEDGRGLFVSQTGSPGSTLHYVDLEGHDQGIWEQKTPILAAGGTFVPSPDGRYLALPGFAVDSNVWMLENF